MKQRILTHNPVAGITRIAHLHDDEQLTIQTIKDESKIWDDNKSLHNMTSSLDRYGDGRVVLRGVPFDLIEDWKARGWFCKEKFHLCASDERAAPYKVFGR